MDQYLQVSTDTNVTFGFRIVTVEMGDSPFNFAIYKARFNDTVFQLLNLLKT